MAKRTMNKHKIPVAFFAYNRPIHTIKSLNSLSACHRKEDFEFYFFLDAAKSTSDAPSVEETRKVLIEKSETFSAKVISRRSNLGVAKSIVDGVSSLCESHGRVVVIEDDLTVAPDFLHFMASALEYYQDCPEVMQVGAYTIAPPSEPRNEDAFLLPVTTAWGWATWASAWTKFSWIPEGWPGSFEDSEWRARFEINGAADYVSMLEETLEGRNDTWDIFWWYAVSRNAGEVVYPLRSLVSNEGFDGSGIHCGMGTQPGQNKISMMANSLPLTLAFPSKLSHHPADLEMLERALRRQKELPTRVKSKIKSLLNQLRRAIHHDNS